MERPINIRFAGMESSSALFAAAHSFANRLAWEHSEIIACWVGIHRDPEESGQAPRYSVRVDVTVPGYELIAKRVPYDSVGLALSHAFEDMERQLAEIDPHINHAEYAVTTPGMLLTAEELAGEKKADSQ